LGTLIKLFLIIIVQPVTSLQLKRLARTENSGWRMDFFS